MSSTWTEGNNGRHAFLRMPAAWIVIAVAKKKNRSAHHHTMTHRLRVLLLRILLLQVEVRFSSAERLIPPYGTREGQLAFAMVFCRLKSSLSACVRKHRRRVSSDLRFLFIADFTILAAMWHCEVPSFISENDDHVLPSWQTF